MGVVIADFSKIETRKKALYVRLKGIPERGKKRGADFTFYLALNEGR